MKNISKLFVLIGVAGALQGCAGGDVDGDFSYESLSDTVEGKIFRNRKYDYARVDVVDAPSLKVPDGLNGSKIKPRFVMPSGKTDFGSDGVEDAQKEILPPNFNQQFDINKIINDQISTLSITSVYDSKGVLKLVFREPTVITLKLLDEYFKSIPKLFKLVSQDDKIMKGTVINVQELKNNMTYFIKVRKIDELSSLVSVSAVIDNTSDKMVASYIHKADALLTNIRKSLTGKAVKHKYNITQAAAAGSSKAGKGKSGLGGMAGAASSIGFGSYDRTIQYDMHTINQNPGAQKNNDASKPDNSTVYDSDAKPQVLS